MTASDYIKIYYEKNPDLPIEVWIEHCMEEYANQTMIQFLKLIMAYYVHSLNDDKFYLPSGEGGWTVEEMLTKFKGNKCDKCGKPVGNITFTLCDDCLKITIKNKQCNNRNVIEGNQSCFVCTFEECSDWY